MTDQHVSEANGLSTFHPIHTATYETATAIIAESIRRGVDLLAPGLAFDHPIRTASHDDQKRMLADSIGYGAAPMVIDEMRAIVDAGARYLSPGLFPQAARAARSTARARGRFFAPIRRTLRARFLPADERARMSRLDDRNALADSKIPLPGHAGLFSTSEKAVIKIVGLICHNQGACEIPLAELARRSFTSPTTIRRAIDKAVAVGAIASFEARRGADGRNLPNRITIVSAEWLADLLRHLGRPSQNQGAQEKRIFSLSGEGSKRSKSGWLTRSPRAEARARHRQKDRTPPS